jgi:L-ribulose-5-phosphate 4-epimerase
MSGDLNSLRAEVLAANLALPASGLVTLTWGNASAIDRSLGLMVIKPSGIGYDVLNSADLVVLDLEGNVVEGSARPSTDTPTHLALYRAFPSIGAVVHTHSTWATAWAQAEHEIPLMGTTHADLSPHPIPLTRALTQEEIEAGYEAATGQALIDAVSEAGPSELPCALVRQHGPFCWSSDSARAVEVAVTLEEAARLASLTMALQPLCTTLDAPLRNKHYERKHGPNGYYGQHPHAATGGQTQVPAN